MNACRFCAGDLVTFRTDDGEREVTVYPTDECFRNFTHVSSDEVCLVLDSSTINSFNGECVKFLSPSKGICFRCEYASVGRMIKA